MGRGKGKRGKDRSRPKLTYHVSQRSYEEKDYEEAPNQRVLVEGPVKDPKRVRPEPVVQFGDDVEDFTDRRKMNTMDDTIEAELFDDAVSEDFDQGFIKEMMDGGFEEEYEEVEEDEYPRHDYQDRALEKQFKRAMQEFNRDAMIDEEDPRAQGPLDITAYSAALEQFVAEHAGDDFMTDGPAKHRGLLNSLRHMADQHRVFDSDARGQFFTALAPKSDRLEQGYGEDAKGLRELTKDRLKRGEIDDTDILYQPDDKSKVVEIKARGETRFDCETIVSTYSTLYNHPNVIASAKKVRPAAPRRAAQPEPDVDEEEEEEEEEAEELLEFDPTVRPKNETPAQKHARRAAIKEMRRIKRSEKKDLKQAFSHEGVRVKTVAPKSKQEKAQMSLSLVRK